MLLEVRAENRKTRRRELISIELADHATHSFGREGADTVFPQDLFLSRPHFAVRCHRHEVELIHLSRSNPTVVLSGDGEVRTKLTEPQSSTRLDTGEAVIAGSYRFQFEVSVAKRSEDQLDEADSRHTRRPIATKGQRDEATPEINAGHEGRAAADEPGTDDRNRAGGPSRPEADVAKAGFGCERDREIEAAEDAAPTGPQGAEALEASSQRYPLSESEPDSRREPPRRAGEVETGGLPDLDEAANPFPNSSIDDLFNDERELPSNDTAKLEKEAASKRSDSRTLSTPQRDEGPDDDRSEPLIDEGLFDEIDPDEFASD